MYIWLEKEECFFKLMFYFIDLIILFKRIFVFFLVVINKVVKLLVFKCKFVRCFFIFEFCGL